MRVKVLERVTVPVSGHFHDFIQIQPGLFGIGELTSGIIDPRNGGGEHVQRVADELGRELNAADIWEAFKAAYHVQTDNKHFQLVDYEESRASDGTRIFTGKIAVDGGEQRVSGRGNGLIYHAGLYLNREVVFLLIIGMIGATPIFPYLKKK